MGYWKAYLMIFAFLDKIWNLNKCNFADFGLLMGLLNPNITAENKPLDEMPVAIWEKVYKSIDFSAINKLDRDELFDTMGYFLNVIAKEYDLNLEQLLKLLQDINCPEITTIWGKHIKEWENYPDYKYGEKS